MKRIAIVLILFFSVVSVSAQSTLTKIDNEYEILVIAKQWEYDVFDLSDLVKTPEEILNDTSLLSLELDTDEFNVDKGASITVHLVSRDVTHGLGIEELDFDIKSNRPAPGVEYGDITTGILDLPDNDTTLETIATVFVGLGTDDMVLTFIVGDPNKSIFSLSHDFIMILSSLILLSATKALRSKGKGS